MIINDVGTLLKFTFQQDISSALDIKLYYKKPFGESGFWNANLIGNDISYVTQLVEGIYDIDQAGEWQFQIYIDMGSWKGRSEVTTIRVGTKL